VTVPVPPPGASGGRPGGPAPRGAGPSAARPHFTGRAAVLAVVLCGIALSLAYPVREYISQRQQIDQLLAQSTRISAHQAALRAEYRMLHSPGYIAQQARDRLHMCLPAQTCYVIIGWAPRRKITTTPVAASPWYARIWSSVQSADSGRADAGQADPGRAGNGQAGGGQAGDREQADRQPSGRRSGPARRTAGRPSG
jgi:cell division protein FtsB